MTIGGSLVFLVVFGGVSYLLISMEERHDKQEQEYLNLIDNCFFSKEDFRQYRLAHPNWTLRKAVRRFFSEPGRLEKALKEKEEREVILKDKEEKRKKEYIVKRVYAYKYESFIFSLFSPFARYNKNDDKWRLSLLARLPKDYVIHKMKLYGYDNPEVLYDDFVKNDLLYWNDLVKECEMGPTLRSYANIISDDDYNLDKWIKVFGRRKSEEELKKDIIDRLPF
ncbi:MAG: hypothetical protein IJ202_02475 [Bacteroidales bacterium]|nr:hypothetical protein [Bacteroidales bacterium]